MDVQTKEALTKAFLVPFETVHDLKNWVYSYLDIDLPIGHIDPDSNSSPAEWMFEAYDTYRKNLGDQVPGFIVLSSRESYKTLSESILAVIMMVHFQCTIAHLAAIVPQAAKAIQYINGFTTRIKPFVEANGMTVDSQSKKYIEIRDGKGNTAYVNIIVATLQGANSEHTNIFTIDEVDVMRFPKAYEEAKLIPGFDPKKGKHPIVIKTSTRKFAFGLMEKEIQNARNANEKLLRWNILDVTERCPEERHRPDLPKAIRYIHPKLPLQNLSPEEHAVLPSAKKGEFNQIEAYGGCAGCPLLPVCKTRLAQRPKEDVGGLYKPISFTINQFKKISPDMGEAQLMCWKPSSSGLIYGRFDDAVDTGNVYTLAKAWEAFTGEKPPKEFTDAESDIFALRMLTDLMLSKGIRFVAGVDWGFRHAFAITVSAQMPNGEWWIVDTHSVPGLEFSDMIKLAEEVRDTYRPKKWYADTSQPMFIKEFKNRRMICAQFDKDVLGGIEATRGQIVDASNRRRMKVLLHGRNDWLIQGFRNHHFKLDSAGNPTKDPDDEEYADVMDTIRYKAQNLFGTKKKAISPSNDPLQPIPMESMSPNQRVYKDFFGQKIQELTTQGGAAKGKSSSGGVIWDMSGDGEDE